MGATNPLLILNTEVFRRTDTKHLVEIIKVLKNTNIITKTWNGVNVLNSSINESGTLTVSSFSALALTDLVQFSSLYFINTTVSNIANIKKNFYTYRLTHFLKTMKHSSIQKVW